MKWLIQPVKIEADKIKSLIDMLKVAGIDYDIVYPFNGDVLNPDKTPYIYQDDETYFVCGSYPLTRNVFKDRKESVFSLDEFNVDSLMNIFGRENFVNYDAKVINVKNIEWIEEEYFVRPLNDDKAFNGGIYNKNTLNYDGEVIIAPLKHINKEHRFFVIDGEIIGSSLYKINGNLATSNIIDEKVTDFAKEMIKKFDFPGFVIDIATLENEQKIMELNCLNAAGFYDINLYHFINAVTDYYEKKSKPKLKM